MSFTCTSLKNSRLASTNAAIDQSWCFTENSFSCDQSWYLDAIHWQWESYIVGLTHTKHLLKLFCVMYTRQWMNSGIVAYFTKNAFSINTLGTKCSKIDWIMFVLLNFQLLVSCFRHVVHFRLWLFHIWWILNNPQAVGLGVGVAVANPVGLRVWLLLLDCHLFYPLEFCFHLSYWMSLKYRKTKRW